MRKSNADRFKVVRLDRVAFVSAALLGAGCSCLQPAKEPSDGGNDGGELGCPGDGGPIASGLITIASGLTAPTEIAADCQSIYWTSGYVGTVVMKAPIGGGVPVTLATGQSSQNGIAVDSTSVYWTAAARLLKAPLGGGPITTLVPVMPADGGGVLEPEQVGVRGALAYFGALDTTSQLAPQGLFMSVPTGGGPVSTVIPEGQGFGTFTLDDAFVYWVGDGGVAMKTPLAGGPSVAIGPVPSGNLAVEGDFLYWVAATVGKIPILGGQAVTLATPSLGPQGQEPGQGVAVDGISVYWTNEFAGTVEKVSVSGGSVVTLASGQDFPVGIAVDAHSVYWANEDNGGTNGSIMQLTPK